MSLTEKHHIHTSVSLETVHNQGTDVPLRFRQFSIINLNYSDFYSLVSLLVNIFYSCFRFFYVSFLIFIGKIFLELL